MARLYTNEHFPAKAVKKLRELEHDVLTIFEAGNAGQRIPDDQVLAYATSNARVVVTINRRDFMRLHRLYPEHAGIIICTEDPDVVGQALRIHEAIMHEDLLQGKLIRIYRPSR